MDKKTSKFIEITLMWWKNNRRDFPWRHTSDPYKTVITEILLRKTTATHVNMVYDIFFNKFPTIHKLAKADINKLKDIIKPLGLVNQRSGQIMQLAKMIMIEYGGEIPDSPELLMKLPGVGEYTTAGVMCISYKKDEPMVDTNFVRVIGRYFGFKSEKKYVYTDPKLWDFVRSIIPGGMCKEFNLGLFDFSNAICIPKNPRCDKCPLNINCCYFHDL